MPPVRNRESHRWTSFELQTMIALIAKGVHLEERGHRNDEQGFEKMNAYEHFATLLNEAVHGKYNYAQDIDKREIVRMLDQLMVDRMHVIGKGGLLERQAGGRLTRSLSMAWNRNSKLNFSGSLSEWKNGRREKVMREYNIQQRLLPAEPEESEKEPAKEGEIHDSFALISYTKMAAPQTPNAASPCDVYPTPNTSTEKSQSRQKDPLSADDYLMRQLEKSRAAAKATTVRPSKWRGKQSALSAAYVDEADDEDIHIPIQPDTTKKFISEAISADMDPFTDLSNKFKDTTDKYELAKPRASHPAAEATAPKRKRPGMNASRCDSMRKPVKKAAALSNFFSGGSSSLAGFNAKAPESQAPEEGLETVSEDMEMSYGIY